MHYGFIRYKLPIWNMHRKINRKIPSEAVKGLFNIQVPLTNHPSPPPPPPPPPRCSSTSTGTGTDIDDHCISNCILFSSLEIPIGILQHPQTCRDRVFFWLQPQLRTRACERYLLGYVCIPGQFTFEFFDCQHNKDTTHFGESYLCIHNRVVWWF